MAECLKPFYKDGMAHPCWHCEACKKTRVSQWSFRLRMEAERSSSAFFVTLTYDNDNCPVDDNGMMTLEKTHLQAFFKALRKKNSAKLKYYAVGEYGTKTWRPHYHVILFNADLATLVGKDVAWLMRTKRVAIDGYYLADCESWNRGHITVGSVNDQTIGYTLKYISKESRIRKNGYWDRRLPEFSLMSKKLGDNYLQLGVEKYHKEYGKLLERCHLTIRGGDKIAMSRYYKSKIYTKSQRAFIGGFHAMNKAKEDSAKTVEDLEYEKIKNKQTLRAYGKDNRKTSEDV